MAPKVSRRRRNGGAAKAQDKEQMLDWRLRLIKKRHQELIVKPRNGLLKGFMDEDGFEEFEERENEFQILDAYGFGR